MREKIKAFMKEIVKSYDDDIFAPDSSIICMFRRMSTDNLKYDGIEDDWEKLLSNFKDEIINENNIIRAIGDYRLLNLARCDEFIVFNFINDALDKNLNKIKDNKTDLL
jgi:hypothetical protein